MITGNQITPGMILSIGRSLYRVDSSVKVTLAKGSPFMKTKLKDLHNGKVTEKNFKLDQPVKDVALQERTVEFLYLEGKDYMFLDINDLEHILVPPDIVGDKHEYLKEGVQLKASFYEATVFSIELPQFLELMVSRTESSEESAVPVSNATKEAILETGAHVSVPPFIEAGDIIKVDTRSAEYIQRV